jgi:hypothetical protein
MGASWPAASGFSALHFRFPGLTGSDPLSLAGPNSVLSPTRPLFKASLVSRFRRSSQGPGRLSDCGGFAEPRARHAMSRSDGGAVFSGDIPRPPPAFMHTGRTPAALHARAGARCAGLGPEPGRDHPARTRRGRTCNRIAVAVRGLLPRDALLPLGHYSCTLGRLGMTSSRLRSAPFPLSTLSSLGRPDPSRLP